MVAAEHVAAFAERLGRLEAALRGIAEAAAGRLPGTHFGVYDYTAACGLAPSEQRLTHPACDFARHVMQVALAGSGVRVSDGSTAVVPAGDDTPAVHAAWCLLPAGGQPSSSAAVSSAASRSIRARSARLAVSSSQVASTPSSAISTMSGQR